LDLIREQVTSVQYTTQRTARLKPQLADFMGGDALDGVTPTFPGLPIELILTILEHALQVAPNKPYANFQKYSLICRVFIVLSFYLHF
jgi:hypothetical protein